MDNTSLLLEFKNIISNITDDDALKYIKMGKGNINLALNYYFNNQTKLQKKASLESQNKTVFSELMEGAKNQSKLEKIFNNLKQDYTKPIQSSIPLNYSQPQEIIGKNKTLDLNIGKFQEQNINMGNYEEKIERKYKNRSNLNENKEIKIYEEKFEENMDIGRSDEIEENSDNKRIYEGTHKKDQDFIDEQATDHRNKGSNIFSEMKFLNNSNNL